MKTKSKRAVGTTLYLPYEHHIDRQRTDMILLQLDRHLNKANWRMAVRGRGSRKEHGNRQDLPKEYAKYLAVYLRPVGMNREQYEREKALWDRNDKQRALTTEREIEIVQLRDSLRAACKEVESQQAQINATNSVLDRRTAQLVRSQEEVRWLRIPWWRRWFRVHHRGHADNCPDMSHGIDISCSEVLRQWPATPWRKP